MNGAIETHRSFVNSWECDENVHMNIQFYWKRFGEAARIFFHLNGISPQPWIDRHVRYHGELMMGTNTIVRSAAGPGHTTTVHHLMNGDSDTLSATAIDTYPKSVEAMSSEPSALPDEAVARSLPTEALEPVDTFQIIQSGRGLVSNRCVVTPQECDARGLLLDQHLNARFSDAASHLWHFLGVSRDWMRERNLGTVAVEMKASRHHEVRAGALMEVVSWAEETRPKTITFRHQVSDMEGGQPLFSGAVTALLMDLKTRRAVELPQIVHRALKD